MTRALPRPTGPREVSVLPARRAHAGPSHAGVEALLGAARREVLVMSDLADGDPIGPVRRVDHDAVRRGVRYRVLVPDHARTEPVPATRLGALSLAGADVRTVAEVPTCALVVDGAVVVLPAERDAGGPATAAFRLPSVVTTTVELFERVWAAAVPLTASDLPDSAELCARERELLSLLSAGSTDESAAARLGISVRTVRRMVADIMNRLGARSRFQAGVKAADRGWLMERAG
ncbi:helix-turn-helix transcriptional regulator [Actinokineospora bangkokensis]|uniref:Helix-turn-helix transcriptional regulator n=1 Tax=Actinokineospora bangkokensis TaxID=1193682 RepID=A0A1Q9LTH3_9PSEU|nr:LuxR C-terminal-related transcriptional regulator [Actinokineospora bangkokensis]OLR95284.1 helix-turn-helix transcriptional regulator [Actinokineospora bangkokensis]